MSRDDDIMIQVFFYIVIFGGLIFGVRYCSYVECREICARNSNKADSTWTQGCFCEDEKGVYNPKDSREAR